VETEFSQLDLGGGQSPIPIELDKSRADAPSGSGSSPLGGSDAGSSRRAASTWKPPRILPDGRPLNSSKNPSPYPQGKWVPYIDVPPLGRRKRVMMEEIG